LNGDVQTNGIEGVWSLFKRSIVASYHRVSAKQFEWRFNQRGNPNVFRDTPIRMVNTPKMETKELVEKGA